MEEAAHQAHAVLRLAVEGRHADLWQALRGVVVLRTRQPVVQVPQQKNRIPGVQALGLLLPVDMQPAMALDNQVEAGPRQAVGARMPATAVASDVKQAGLEFQAL
ncbi:hypothetical protein D3C73_932530 [compost metagenome]